jgi:hypothetical protein
MSLCTYCHAPLAPRMQAEFDLSPLFRGAPTPPREACPDPDELAGGDERRRTRRVDAQHQVPDRAATSVLVSRQRRARRRNSQAVSRLSPIFTPARRRLPGTRDRASGMPRVPVFIIAGRGTADMERFSARNDLSRLTRSGHDIPRDDLLHGGPPSCPNRQISVDEQF